MIYFLKSLVAIYIYLKIPTFQAVHRIVRCHLLLNEITPNAAGRDVVAKGLKQKHAVYERNSHPFQVMR
jgi:hypothetical protein